MSMTLHRIALLVCLMVGVALPSNGQTAARIDAHVAPFVEAGHLSASILVARGGKVLYERSFGSANRELGVPVTPETRFNVASLTKPMTQIIAFRMIEGGALAADQLISDFIPGFPRADEISVGMLLSHRAGIPHRVTADLEETVPQTAETLVELAAQHELKFEPGSESSYSTAGYSVLARVLELASGKSYSELLAEHVFAPSGMASSIHPAGEALIPLRASSYRFAGDGSVVNSPLKNYSFLVGGGSVFSTPRDLFRLMRHVVSGNYGEGVTTQLLREGGLAWNGRTDGYRSFADYHPDSDVYVAFVSNTLTGAGDLLRRDLPRLVDGDDVPAPVVPNSTAVAVDPDLLTRYAGDYQLRPGSNLTLSIENGQVFMSGWLLIPTSDSTFFSPQDYGQIEVISAEDGSIERLDWTTAGNTYPMPRVSKASE